jgi:hypothetical protein
MTMQKPSAFLIYGGVGITLVGVAYDGGLFGPTDGQDHSAVFSVPVGATGTVAQVTFTVVNNVTGDEIVAPLPNTRPTQRRT